MENIAVLKKVPLKTGLQVQVCDKQINPEWDEFVANSPTGSHVQTSLWAQVKAATGWRALRIIVRDTKSIVGGGQVLIRKITPFFTFGFIPRGPLCSPDDAVCLEAFFTALRDAAAKQHIQYLAVQPSFDGTIISKLLHQWDFSPSWLELSCTATILIDLSLPLEAIQAQMKRQTRQNIRRSEREGIKIREGDEKDLAALYQFHVLTSQRQGFTPYSENYYNEMWQILWPRHYIHLILAEYEGKPVSALLLIAFGETVVAKILGWSGEHPECRPNDAAFWASIQWAKANGYRYFDLEGVDRSCAAEVLQGNSIPEDKKDSYTFFKLGYGGKITLYPEAYDYVYNPIFRLIYRKIFSTPERRAQIYGWFDQFRRKYG